MSLTIVLGIVAVVNLAIGYALALVIEGEHGLPADSGEAPIIPSPAISTEPTSATAAPTVQLIPARPVANTDREILPAVERESIDPVAVAIAPDAPSSEVLPNKSVDSAAKVPLADLSETAVEPAPSVDKNIVNCELWLNTAEELLSEEQELRPTHEAPPTAINVEPPVLKPELLEPRATLADAEQLEAAITSWWQNDPQRTRPICVGQIEIDNLRQLTAELGATVAGNLAKQIEARLLHVLRRDDLVASLGRSRFLVLFPNAEGATSARLLDQLRGRVEATDFIQDGKTIHATLTAGVAQATVDESTESFLARAADALAEARAKGRNRVAWHDGASASLIEPRRPAEPAERVAI